MIWKATKKKAGVSIGVPFIVLGSAQNDRCEKRNSSGAFSFGKHSHPGAGTGVFALGKIATGKRKLSRTDQKQPTANTTPRSRSLTVKHRVSRMITGIENKVVAIATVGLGSMLQRDLELDSEVQLKKYDCYEMSRYSHPGAGTGVFAFRKITTGERKLSKADQKQPTTNTTPRSRSKTCFERFKTTLRSVMNASKHILVLLYVSLRYSAKR